MAKDPTGMKGAAQVANTPQSRRGRDAGDILSQARTRMQLSLTAYSESRDSELDDLRFMAGSPDNRWQWPQEVLATRGAVQGQTINARPCLTINKLPQHVRQVTNDQRQNRPSGKVIPVDDQADIEVAEVFDGIVRHIEYISDADVAYDTACENQVTYGEGYIRILTEYCDDNTFDQDIRIGRVRNSFSVYMDPHIQDPCGSDAEWCFITEDMPREEFERHFPDAEPISSIQQRGTGDENLAQWITDNSVRIAEYFYAYYEKAKLNLYPGNQTAFAGSPEAKQLEMMGLQAVRSREVDIRKIKWIKTNGYEILEEQEWPGKWIPVIRVVGNEYEVEGRIYISGLVRNAKDAQRMYNYWVSQEAEMLALAPKAPFIGYGGQFERLKDADFLKVIKYFKLFSANTPESNKYFNEIRADTLIFDFCKDAIKMFKECNNEYYILCCNFIKAMALCSNNFYNNLPAWLLANGTGGMGAAGAVGAGGAGGHMGIGGIIDNIRINTNLETLMGAMNRNNASELANNFLLYYYVEYI